MHNHNMTMMNVLPGDNKLVNVVSVAVMRS